jgi:hypothetical protein
VLKILIQQAEPRIHFPIGTRVIIRATEDDPTYDRAGEVWRLNAIAGVVLYGVHEDGSVGTKNVYGVAIGEVTWCEGWQLTRA